jgi:demethylmenaquinone methyltransferase/2-methoxy-6-polyprenyl-1,4-benzoquinol methylase
MSSEKIRQKEPATVQRMFNAIAPRYDVLNHLLSFGFDIAWRKKAVKLISEKRNGAVLDLAAGSGDFSLEAKAINPSFIVAADFATNMYDVFRKKCEGMSPDGVIHFVACDALTLPFRPESFDVVMVAFGIRNFADRPAALREMNRVLRPNGIVLILELTKPKKPVISKLYTIYSKFIMPVLGKIISRHGTAYSYLPQSIGEFPENDKFASLLTEAGFKEVNIRPLSFSVAAIFTGRKISMTK